MAIQIAFEDVNDSPHEFLSSAYISNGHIFTSGCVGYAEDGTISSDIEIQTKLAIKSLEKILSVSGASLNSVLNFCFIFQINRT